MAAIDRDFASPWNQLCGANVLLITKQEACGAMPRKTFISYKYSEAQTVRDRILEALGADATYYQEETSDSPDLTDTSTENIKQTLTDMMYDTSVTIVVISPSIKQSKWVDWEIEYSLKEISRKGRTSKTNGVIGVIQAVNGGSDWLATTTTKNDGCTVRSIAEAKLYPIIADNRYNQKKKTYTCLNCKTYSPLNGSYVSLVDESDFIADPDKYIENAAPPQNLWAI